MITTAQPMKVLIACECSGVVRDAFLDLGHDAWSCDLKRAERPSNRHIVGDARDLLGEGWDLLMVAHPPCTRLTNSGVRWLTSPPGEIGDSYSAEERAEYASLTTEEDRLAFMWASLDRGAQLFSDFWNAPIDRIAVENPVMHKHAKARIRNFQPHAQSLQPWQFGHDDAGEDNVKKRTCFWLRGLPKLTPTGTLDGSTARAEIHEARRGPKRSEERARFFPGMARAIAEQWGGHALDQLAAA